MSEYRRLTVRALSNRPSTPRNFFFFFLSLSLSLSHSLSLFFSFSLCIYNNIIVICILYIHHTYTLFHLSSNPLALSLPYLSSLPLTLSLSLPLSLCKFDSSPLYLICHPLPVPVCHSPIIMQCAPFPPTYPRPMISAFLPPSLSLQEFIPHLFSLYRPYIILLPPCQAFQTVSVIKNMEQVCG